MNNTKIIVATLVVAIIHFLLTSLLGHYIAVQIGTEMGQIVGGGIMAASDESKSEEEITRIYQDMKSKREDI